MHGRLPAVRGRGPVGRRGQRRRATPRPRRRRRAGRASTCTATTSLQADLDYAIEAGVGCIVVDSFDEIERLRGRGVRAMVRVTPGIRPSTHTYIQTGQEDSKFGFGSADVPRAVRGLPRRRPRAARAARPHRLAGPRAAGVRAAHRGARGPRRLAVAQPRRRARDRLHERRLAAADRGLRRRADAAGARGCHGAVRAGPLARRQRGRDALHGRDRQGHPGCPHVRRRRRRHVRQPASDAVRGALRGRDRRPLRRRGALHGCGHALRVRRHPRPRRPARLPAPWATCS